ncbi:unnamed protein product [Phyllotreta striolata]|uniref:Reelin domain-containing protein n=1 Tax=Phyllotreta striolata TaxID=444603 RepID=A0A9N9TEZ2_PHYSR|nr:unnamed protein product [Phyllotreta striolata]
MISIFFLCALCVIQHCYAFSGGAPDLMCDDMLPLHIVPPQHNKHPYKISVNQTEIKAGEAVEIEIAGDKFKGLMMEVRRRKDATGKFLLDEEENDFKTINCHRGKKNTLTHQNNANKKNKKIVWKSPNVPGKYTIYATIAKDGFVFWTKIPAAEITVE